MRFDILTIFPQIFDSYFQESIIKRGIQKELLTINIHDIRKFSQDKHKKVDDAPFGGGAGMVMTPQPLYDCIQEVKNQNKGPVIYLSPRGKTLAQPLVEKLQKKHTEMIIICGRYEGIDQRIIELCVDMEISIGKFVITGGELGAMVLVDSISRLVPEVLGKEESHQEESFSLSLDRKKEYPHYTRPAEFHGLQVPEVLMSGNHAKITAWRKSKLK